MKEIRKEYQLKTTPSLLFNRISSASGLSEWFADNVNFEESWSLSHGEIQCKRQRLRVWYPINPFVFAGWSRGLVTEFEFTINEDELTGDIALIVTDMVEEDEEEDAINLWDSQISRLKRAIGS